MGRLLFIDRQFNWYHL